MQQQFRDGRYVTDEEKQALLMNLNDDDDDDNDDDNDDEDADVEDVIEDDYIPPVHEELDYLDIIISNESQNNSYNLDTSKTNKDDNNVIPKSLVDKL